ncbi:tetratricopeptide repeat protein [Marinobacterium sp. D7]|uniref:tetratricopeptide repeat protein n=1 Tax=Marinobacterium ramblicola TaxID=2849041 RepID=UPI001C2D663E|nr:tetratricopeptide repeat protein [Marinobacterium ramblicola]MBV1789691.1 tetratricopeptide repeat protein [Marinobacterium ramblicola]
MNASSLNAQELMHLALYASENDTPDKAIDHLKQLLKIEPDNGKALYLLGALHAEIGMHDLAVEEMARALELDAQLPDTARFQLGLLHLTAGRIDDAEETWKGLEVLGTEHALHLFKTGLLHMVRDEFQESAEALRAGIERNSFSEDLNNDMRRVLRDVENAAGSESSKPADSGDSQRMLLSIYEKQEH